MRPKKKQQLGLVGSLGCAAVILWLTPTPQEYPSSKSLPLDKLAHATAFAAYVLPTALLYRPGMVPILALGVLLGGGIELVRPMFYRAREWTDFGADVAGLILGAAVGLGFGALVRGIRKNVAPAE